MRLTQWTDYTLRVLMYCAACNERVRPVTITEIASAHDISRSHLTKIVQQLAAQGLLETSRGRGGGIRLKKSAKDINVGALVRQTESDFEMVECFNLQTNTCRMSTHCLLQTALRKAMQAYFVALDAMTLADLVPPLASASQTVHFFHGLPTTA